jgi:hypothetical protein
MPLPAKIQAGSDQVARQASHEVTPSTAPAAVATEVETQLDFPESMA